MLFKLVKLIEKLWVKQEIEDKRYYLLIINSVKKELNHISADLENEGRIYFLFFVNILTSYFRPKDDKYSKAHKINRSIVYSLIKHFDTEIYDTLYRQLHCIYDKFVAGKASIRAVYKNNLLEEVVEERSQAELIRPENALLISEWEGAFGTEIFSQEIDQFLFNNLIDLLYNLINGSKSEITDKPKDILDLIENSMQVEQPKHELVISQEWIELLTNILLEPTLEFV